MTPRLQRGASFHNDQTEELDDTLPTNSEGGGLDPAK